MDEEHQNEAPLDDLCGMSSDDVALETGEGRYLSLLTLFRTSFRYFLMFGSSESRS